jgi:hypothetical protein
MVGCRDFYENSIRSAICLLEPAQRHLNIALAHCTITAFTISLSDRPIRRNPFEKKEERQHTLQNPTACTITTAITPLGGEGVELPNSK